jgi:transposase
MPAKVTLRELTPEELKAIDELARTRTAPARLVDRARIIQAAARGQSAGLIAAGLGCSRPTVYAWIRRFNAEGPRGLEERPRSGRPHTYTAEQRAEVIAAALTDPKGLGLPFGCWTLDRLQAYLNEPKGIPIKRSRIDEILVDEGLRWRKDETWFGERVDPAFAEKRGPSRRSTPHRRRARPSSASMRWAPRVPRASRAGSSSAPGHDKAPTARPSPSSGPSKRSTTAAAARGTSSGRSSRPAARP